jgi:hypothetical protein
MDTRFRYWYTEGLKATANTELIAPCGMNCALCSRYLALKNKVRSKGVRMAYCTGCRPRNRTCAALKKKCEKLLNREVTFCFECNSFPCDILRKIDTKYKARYRMSMIENLNFIRDKGIDKFLEAQEKRWKCPICSEMVCCHNGICFICGLTKLKSKKEKYLWDDEQEAKGK